jgi:hypothetical protein
MKHFDIFWRRFRFGALAAVIVLLAGLLLGQRTDVLAQGSPGSELTTITDSTQFEPGYPCTTSCFTKAQTLKSYMQSAASGQSIAANLVHTGNWKPLAITDGTDAACVATTTFVAQLYVPARMTITGVAIVNGTAVAGNVQVGLADSTGAPITAALSASTAQSGTGAYQRIPFAAPYTANPGTYYVQLQCNNASARFRAHTVGDFRTTTQTSGTYGTFVSFTPPTTFTTAVGPVGSLY